VKRIAKIIKSAANGKRHIAIDCVNADEILEFLSANNLVKKFNLICQVILMGLRNSDLYDKENINEKSKHVTAMKFKGHINTRIYCMELKKENNCCHCSRIITGKEKSEEPAKRNKSY